jgi:hypothetical protein
MTLRLDFFIVLSVFLSIILLSTVDMLTLVRRKEVNGLFFDNMSVFKRNSAAIKQKIRLVVCRVV